jgi:hypothetical protein
MLSVERECRMGRLSAGMILAGALVVSSRLLSAAAENETRPPLIEKIESLTGIPVTQYQREAIARVSGEARRRMVERQRAFVAALRERGTIPGRAERALTPIDGLPFDFDRDALAVICAFAEEPPEQAERDTIRILDAQRRRDLARIRQEHAEALSGITDLPADTLRQILEDGSPKAEGRR